MEEMEAKGGRAKADDNSVTTMEGGKAIVDSALDSFGRVDIVATTAGIMSNRLIFRMSEEEWDSVINVHLKGNFTIIRYASEVFRENKCGRIITFTSEAGILGGAPGQTNYSTAKGGIISFTKAVARDLERYNVTANCICPRAFTRLTEGIEEARDQGIELKLPLLLEPDRPFKDMDPDDVARFAIFLASDEAQEITGKVFLVYANVVALVNTGKVDSVAWKPGKWTVKELKNLVPNIILK